MSRRKETTAKPAAIASAQVIARQRLTCENCVGLRIKPRPMCQAEASPHFRQVRDTYHERCPAFAVTLKAMQAPPAAEPAAAPRHEIVGHAGRDKRLKINRRATDEHYAALWARNANRKVGA